MKTALSALVVTSAIVASSVVGIPRATAEPTLSYSWSPVDSQGVQVGIAGPSSVGRTPRLGQMLPNKSIPYDDADKISVAIRSGSARAVLCGQLPPSIDLQLFTDKMQQIQTFADGPQYSHPQTFIYALNEGSVYQRKRALILTDMSIASGSYYVVAHVSTNVCPSGRLSSVIKESVYSPPLQIHLTL